MFFFSWAFGASRICTFFITHFPGVNDVKTNVTDQTVRIMGTESLKSLLKALEETGRSSRLIGQGSLEGRSETGVG